MQLVIVRADTMSAKVRYNNFRAVRRLNQLFNRRIWQGPRNKARHESIQTVISLVKLIHALKSSASLAMPLPTYLE